MSTLQDIRTLHGNMLQIKRILDSIGATSSRNEKENILYENRDNLLLQKVLEYTYNSNKVYGFGKKSLKDIDKLELTMVQTKFSNIFDLLDYLMENNLSNQVKDDVIIYLSTTPPPIRDLYVKMILKDLKVGITEKTVNKIWDGLIETFEVMRAKKYTDYVDKIKDGTELFVTLKFEDFRAIIIKNNGNIVIKSRQGKEILGCVEILEEAQYLPDGYVYDGGLIKVNKNNLTRDELFSETQSLLLSNEPFKRDLNFHLYDMITIEEFKNGKSKDKYSMRKARTSNIIQEHNYQFIKYVPLLYRGTDKNVVRKLFEDALEKDEEGVMINLDKPYECKKTANILKYKADFTADVKVINIIEGKEESNKGKLGSVTIMFADDEGEFYTCNCGSGFKEDETELFFNNPELILNKIIEVGHKGITTNKNGGKGLRFAKFIRVRHDKTDLKDLSID